MGEAGEDQRATDWRVRQRVLRFMKEKIVPYRTANEVERILNIRFCAPEYAFLAQVRNQTGFSKTVRTADALAMSLYPSRGLSLFGFEIKISRSDWLSELKKPDKAEEFYQFCDYWYLVVNGPQIVAPGELPATWGLIDVSAGKCRTITEAPSNPERKPPDIRFMAGVLRKASEIQRVNDMAELIAATTKAREEGKEMAMVNMKWELDRAESLRKSVDDFEKISGVRIDSWNSGNVAEAVRQIKSGVDILTRLRHLKTNLDNIAREVDVALALPEEKNPENKS
jgi:hypothetical protein